jgi:predicted DNA-binding transcriptional regulator AlpA
MSQQDQIIRPRNIRTITGLSKVTVWRLEKKGEFPKRVRLSSGAVGWRMSEVMAWLESRQAA